MKVLTIMRAALLVSVAVISVYLFTRIVYERGRINIQLGEVKQSADYVEILKSADESKFQSAIDYIEKMNIAKSVEFETLKANNSTIERTFYALVLNIILLIVVPKKKISPSTT
jgi:hypothetical protein